MLSIGTVILKITMMALSNQEIILVIPHGVLVCLGKCNVVSKENSEILPNMGIFGWQLN